jgi:hypothetical protein
MPWLLAERANNPFWIVDGLDGRPRWLGGFCIGSPYPRVMLRGALAMFDALGFKGIWRQVDRPEAVVEKLREMQAGLDSYLCDNFGGEGCPALQDPANTFLSIHSTFLSDTVALAVVPKPRDELHEIVRNRNTDDDLAAAAVAYASTLSGYVCRQGLFADPPWAYRGCIAFGEFYMEDRFLVGEAVDEAADNMNVADGAFVWLCLSARKAFERSPGGFGGRGIPLARYKVPLKGEAGSVDTFVASPFEWLSTVQRAQLVAKALLRTFEGKPDQRIVCMAQNTQTFLEYHLRELAAERAESDRLRGIAP